MGGDGSEEILPKVTICNVLGETIQQMETLVEQHVRCRVSPGLQDLNTDDIGTDRFVSAIRRHSW